LTISPELEHWLRDAGYEYHCFVSWPHTIDSEITGCALHVRDVIQQTLARDIPDPRVFLDETHLLPGTEWSLALRAALCRSVTMVAICAPIYYDSTHHWCGREWAFMYSLSRARLAGHDFTTIIPLIFRMSSELPEPVKALQYVDISKVQVRGRRYYNTIEFRSHIQDIVTRIEQVATALRANGALAGCEELPPPPTSAFSNYSVPRQPFPLKTESP